MRSATSLITLVLCTLGTAQSAITGLNFTNLPTCAQTCLTANSGQAQGCSLSDFGCFCRSTDFVDTLSCCLVEGCNESDQKASLAFEVALCGTYNVSIPNFLGCSPLDPVSSSHIPAVGFTLPTNVISVTSQTATTLSSYIPAYTTTDGGPLAAFDGNALLTGTCTIAAFASYAMANGGIMQFPYIGCSNQDPACCPFKPDSPGPLTQCPRDFYTTSSACCPSGWTVASSPLAGQTYCATSPIFNILPASAATVLGATAIATQVFSLRYELGQPKIGLHSGAIAGIAIGAVAGGLLVALGALLLFRARRRRAQAMQDASSTITPDAVGRHGHASSLKIVPGTPIHGIPQPMAEFPETLEIPRTELPSPSSQSPRSPYSIAGSPGSPATATGLVPVSPALYPQELPGSSHIHEHHPAFQAQDAPVKSPPRTPTSFRTPPRTTRSLSASLGSAERYSSNIPLGVSPPASNPHREDFTNEAVVGRAD